MKKLLLFAIICLFSTKAFCVNPKLTIINNEPCDVYVVLYGDYTSCSYSYVSAMIRIPANSTVFYQDPGAVPMSNGSLPLYPSGIFTKVDILFGPPSSCAPPGAIALDGCGSLSVIMDLYTPALCPSYYPAVPITWTYVTSTAVRININ